MVNSAFNAFLLVCAGLLPIVNPIGGAPIFLALTRQASETAREAIARRVAINGFLLLLGSLLVGSYVLEFFGITLPIVRVAGGLVVSAFAWRLLQSGDGLDSRRAADATPRPVSLDDAFYPLTMPLTVGPGSISVALTLGSQRSHRATADIAHAALIGGAAIVGLVAVALAIYVCYRFAEGVISFLGNSGAEVLIRLSAFILLCIGISILWGGCSELVASLKS
jgi:multiple antibiotic resistance protein